MTSQGDGCSLGLGDMIRAVLSKADKGDQEIGDGHS